VVDGFLNTRCVTSAPRSPLLTSAIPSREKAARRSDSRVRSRGSPWSRDGD
jgi:hypothetical protein